MKFLFDFFPILLFFIAYKFYGIYAATATAIVAAFLQVGLYWLKNRSFEKSHLITLVIIVIFGGATLYLQNPEFIKWKPTIIYWIFSIAFIGSQFIGKEPLIKRMMGKALSVDDTIWNKLNISWAIFFICMGFVNLYVFKNYDEDTWVNFKLFGLMGLTLVFIIAQGFYLSRYIEEDNTEKEIKEDV